MKWSSCVITLLGLYVLIISCLCYSTYQSVMSLMEVLSVYPNLRVSRKCTSQVPYFRRQRRTGSLTT